MNGEHYCIGISGSYGGMNMGDEAILQSMIRQLRNSLPDVKITVFSKNPEDTQRRHEVDKAVPMRKLTREELTQEIKELDLFILGGGGILFQTEAKSFIREALLAKEFGVPVMVYAISVGPVSDSSEQLFITEGLNKFDLITVRERQAKKILEEWGVTRPITVTADAALLLEPEPVNGLDLEREGIEDSWKLIGISVREPGPAASLDLESYYSHIANAADYMVERFDARVIFIPMERYVLDMQHAHMVISKMLNAEKAQVLKGEYSPGQLLTIAKHFVFGVGMRLHFLIFLALNGIPFVALPYASKVEGFLDQLGIQLPPPFLNPGRLIAYIDEFWDHREELTDKICATVPHLKEKAEETNVMAVHLLKSTAKSKAWHSHSHSV